MENKKKELEKEIKKLESSVKSSKKYLASLKKDVLSVKLQSNKAKEEHATLIDGFCLEVNEYKGDIETLNAKNGKILVEISENKTTLENVLQQIEEGKGKSKQILSDTIDSIAKAEKAYEGKVCDLKAKVVEEIKELELIGTKTAESKLKLKALKKEVTKEQQELKKAKARSEHISLYCDESMAKSKEELNTLSEESKKMSEESKKNMQEHADLIANINKDKKTYKALSEDISNVKGELDSIIKLKKENSIKAKLLAEKEAELRTREVAMLKREKKHNKKELILKQAQEEIGE